MKSNRSQQKVAFVGIALVAGLILSGCTTGLEEATGETPAGGTQLTGERGAVDDLAISADELSSLKDLAAGSLVGIVSPMNSDYFSSVANGAKSEAERLGFSAQIYDSGLDASKGVTGIENFTTSGADAIIVFLSEPAAMMTAVQDAIDAGIVVIQFAGAEAGDVGGFALAVDDHELGAAAGEVGADIINANGYDQVAILDYPTLPNVVQRADGIEDALTEGAPDVEIVGRFLGGTQENGLSSTESLLQKYPNLDGIVAINDAGGFGAEQAFAAAGRTGANTFVVGIDAEARSVEEIKAGGGIIQGTIDTQPTLTGQLAADLFGKYILGNKVAQFFTVPVVAITE